MGALNIIAAWNGILRRLRIKNLVFYIDEHLLYVGQINEPAATSFIITEGENDLSISNTGDIQFNIDTNYQIKRKYILKAESDKGSKYLIVIYLNDTFSAFELNSDTLLMYNTIF